MLLKLQNKTKTDNCHQKEIQWYSIEQNIMDE